MIFAITINETLEPLTIAEPLTEQGEEKAPAPIKAKRPLGGVALFGAVFDELSVQLGDEFSSAELMNAAQLLIEVSRSEYVPNPYKDPIESAGYFSWDLVRAFKQPWHVTELETYRMEHRDELSLETMESARLLQQGWNQRKWEF